MCGRFALGFDGKFLATEYGLTVVPALSPRYNIAPAQPVFVICNGEHGREGQHCVWGLVPRWAKELRKGAGLINARSETVAEKPSFRAAFKHRRCIVPASGFYEWKREGGRKVPHYIFALDKRPFAFAGIWERRLGADGSELRSCAILTTTPNGLVQAVHDRMPVILSAEDVAVWLATGSPVGHLHSLLRPYPSEKMAMHVVSSFVNNVRNEGLSCIQPVPTARRLL